MEGEGHEEPHPADGGGEVRGPQPIPKSCSRREMGGEGRSFVCFVYFYICGT